MGEYRFAINTNLCSESHFTRWRSASQVDFLLGFKRKVKMLAAYFRLLGFVYLAVNFGDTSSQLGKQTTKTKFLICLQLVSWPKSNSLSFQSYLLHICHHKRQKQARAFFNRPLQKLGHFIYGNLRNTCRHLLARRRLASLENLANFRLTQVSSESHSFALSRLILSCSVKRQAEPSTVAPLRSFSVLTPSTSGNGLRALLRVRFAFHPPPLLSTRASVRGPLPWKRIML